MNRLKKPTDLDYYARARIDARIAAITPTVLELKRLGVRDEAPWAPVRQAYGNVTSRSQNGSVLTRLEAHRLGFPVSRAKAHPHR